MLTDPSIEPGLLGKLTKSAGASDISASEWINQRTGNRVIFVISVVIGVISAVLHDGPVRVVLWVIAALLLAGVLIGLKILHDTPGGKRSKSWDEIAKLRSNHRHSVVFLDELGAPWRQSITVAESARARYLQPNKRQALETIDQIIWEIGRRGAAGSALDRSLENVADIIKNGDPSDADVARTMSEAKAAASTRSKLASANLSALRSLPDRADAALNGTRKYDAAIGAVETNITGDLTDVTLEAEYLLREDE